MKNNEEKTEVEVKIVERVAHCRIALNCYIPPYQRAALTAITKTKGARLSKSDIKDVCLDLTANGYLSLDVLVNSLLDSLTDLTPEDTMRVVKALEEQLPDEEKKYKKQVENNRLLDKILNDILAKLSNNQLETILKDVKAAKDYTTAFILAVGHPELTDKVQSELSDRDETEETEFPEFAPIEAFLASMSNREKVICALLTGLSLATNCSTSKNNRYLEEELWQKTQRACMKDAKALVSDSELGYIATVATVLDAVVH